MIKKASLPILYTFLLVIGVMVLLIIVALLTGWAQSTREYASKLFGIKEETIPDIQQINVSCDEAPSEIIKYAKLCYTKGNQGLLHGTLCYGITSPGGCGIIQTEISDSLALEGVVCGCHFNADDSKFLISYDYLTPGVIIE